MTSPYLYTSPLRLMLLLTSSLACSVQLERKREGVNDTLKLAAAVFDPMLVREMQHRSEQESKLALCNHTASEDAPMSIHQRHLNTDSQQPKTEDAAKHIGDHVIGDDVTKDDDSHFDDTLTSLFASSSPGDLLDDAEIDELINAEGIWRSSEVDKHLRPVVRNLAGDDGLVSRHMYRQMSSAIVYIAFPFIIVGVVTNVIAFKVFRSLPRNVTNTHMTCLICFDMAYLLFVVSSHIVVVVFRAAWAMASAKTFLQLYVVYKFFILCARQVIVVATSLMSLDRYFVIASPFRTNNFCIFRRPRLLILLFSLLILAFNSHKLLKREVKSGLFPGSNHTVSYLGYSSLYLHNHGLLDDLTIASSCLFQYCPLFAMLVANISLMISLYRYSRRVSLAERLKGGARGGSVTSGSSKGSPSPARVNLTSVFSRASPAVARQNSKDCSSSPSARQNGFSGTPPSDARHPEFSRHSPSTGRNDGFSNVSEFPAGSPSPGRNCRSSSVSPATGRQSGVSGNSPPKARHSGESPSTARNCGNSSSPPSSVRLSGKRSPALWRQTSTTPLTPKSSSRRSSSKRDKKNAKVATANGFHSLPQDSEDLADTTNPHQSEFEKEEPGHASHQDLQTSVPAQQKDSTDATESSHHNSQMQGTHTTEGALQKHFTATLDTNHNDEVQCTRVTLPAQQMDSATTIDTNHRTGEIQGTQATVTALQKDSTAIKNNHQHNGQIQGAETSVPAQQTDSTTKTNQATTDSNQPNGQAGGGRVVTDTAGSRGSNRDGRDVDSSISSEQSLSASVRSRTLSGNRAARAERQFFQLERHKCVTVIIYSFLFFILALPLALLPILKKVFPEFNVFKSQHYFFLIYVRIFPLLDIISASMNFFVFFIKGEAFRAGVRRIVRCQRGGHRHGTFILRSLSAESEASQNGSRKRSTVCLTGNVKARKT